MEAIERVARAICIAKGINPDHIGELPRDDGSAVNDHAFRQWELHKREATAAINALWEIVEENDEEEEVWRFLIGLKRT